MSPVTTLGRRDSGIDGLSGGHGESVLSAMPCAKTRNALIVSDKRTGEIDCGGDQKPIGRIAVLEMMQPVAAGGRLVTQWHRFDAGTLEEAVDPCLNGDVEIDPAGVYK